MKLVSVLTFVTVACATDIDEDVPKNIATVDTSPMLALKGVHFNIRVNLPPSKDLPQFISWLVVEDLGDGTSVNIGNGTLDVYPNSSRVAKLNHEFEVEPRRGEHRLTDMTLHFVNNTVLAPVGGFKFQKAVFYGFVSVLPPIVTMILAIAIGEVLPALLAGIWVGACLVHNNFASGFLRVFDEYWSNSFVEDGHNRVLVFTFLLGGLIKLTQENGGTQGLAKIVRGMMKSTYSGQVAIWAFCLCVFIDDYTSILISGAALKSVVPLLGISIYKLAHIVHSMAVPLASMMPISSWVGVEVSYLESQRK